jgi:alpha/beta superfamily hydrolase
MIRTEIIEEKITLTSGKLRLAGVLAYPPCNDPVRAVLLCSPHPHFAGDMENNVIKALAQQLAKESVTLRFDYRGVSDSEINLPTGLSVFDYWQEVEQQRNYNDALDDVTSAATELTYLADGLPLVVVGYSFGAVTGIRFGQDYKRVDLMIGISPPWKRVAFDFLVNCPKPTLLLGADNDFLYSQEEIARIREQVPSEVTIEIMQNGDHFFRGEENIVCDQVEKFIHSIIPCEERK